MHKFSSCLSSWMHACINFPSLYLYIYIKQCSLSVNYSFSRCKIMHAPFLSISPPCTFSIYQLISSPLSSPVWGLDMSPHLWVPAALPWSLSGGRTTHFCISHKTLQNLQFLLCLEKAVLFLCTRNRRPILNTPMQFSAPYLISVPPDLRNNIRYGCEMHACSTMH